MLKQFSWPYQIMAVICIVILTGFMRQPDALLQELQATIEKGEETKWQSLMAEAELQPYAKAIMEAYIKMKYSEGLQAEGPMSATNSYYLGLGALDDLSQQLAKTKGFRYMMCADLASFPKSSVKNTEGCWQLSGEVEWQSATQVRVYFTNPVTAWQSVLLLQRTGLFSWQVSGVELPIEEMLAAYAKQLKA